MLFPISKKGEGAAGAIISVQNKKKRSYIVIKCPLYKKDGEDDTEDKH